MQKENTKHRNKYVILILAASVILLAGGFILWKTQPWVTPAPSAFPETGNFTPLASDPGKIIKIDFVFNQNKDNIHLIRDAAKGWILADQSDKTLPQDQMDLALNLLMNLSAVSDVPADIKREQLGLDPPIAKVTLFLSDGWERVLDIGKLDHASGLYFVRIDGEKPFLTDFDTVYSILKIFYLKVLPVSLTKDSVPTQIITRTP